MNISDWRQRMDEIDKKLVELLNERSQCALEIGRLKQAAGMPIYQPARENVSFGIVQPKGQTHVGIRHRR